MSFLYQSGAYSNRKKRSYHRAGAAGAAVVFSFSVLQAQEIPTESARLAFLDLGQRLEFSDNPDLDVDGEDRFTSRTTLDFGIGRRNGINGFGLLLGADLEIRDDGDIRVTSPAFAAAFARDVASAGTRLSFGVREVDLGTTTRTDFDSDTGSVDFGTFDGGKRLTADIALEGDFGRDAPFGGNYLLSQRKIDYSDTEDSDLRDADRTILEGGLFFVLSPRHTVGLEASYINFDERGPGQIDTETTYAGTYVESEINPRLTGRFGLGYEKAEETGSVENTEEGPVFDAALTQALPRGALTFAGGSTYSAAGRRDELSVEHLIETPRNDFTYLIGVTDTEGLDPEPLFGLSWAPALPRGALLVSLEQTPFTDRDAGSQINSLFTVEYEQELTTRSGFDVDLRFLDINDQDSSRSGGDTQRLDLALTYRHMLTEEWDLTSGLAFTRVDEDSGDDRDANTIFIGLERRFAWN